MKLTGIILTVLFFGFVLSEVYFHETFNAGWEKRWIQAKRDGLGALVSTEGEFNGKPTDKGVKTSQDAKFYASSAAFPKTFNNEGKTTVLQFLVKFEQGIDCGGGYLKFLPKFDQEKFEGSTQYNMMFGPDICGSSTKKVHLIFSHNGKNLDWKKTLTCETDKLSHIYTAIIRPDNTYEVLIDGVKKESGNLLDDWDFSGPKTIPDPTQHKPSDWVEESEIVDPEDKKPGDWDHPKTIADPNAKVPEDWNEEEDGKWTAPEVPNPDYKGEYVPRMIPNPAYKGVWKADEIPNPDYVEDSTVYKYKDFSVVGIDVWQVKAGTIYDDILITDSEEEAATQRTELLERIKKEKEAFDRAEDIKREQQEKERKEAEEKAKNTPPPTPQEAETHADQDLEKLAREKAEQLKKEAGDATGRDEL
jgi:calreticulin